MAHAVRSRPASSRDRGGFSGRLLLVWRIGLVLFALQLIGMLVLSWHLWHRFDLTSDFATFSQAWEQIARGHLNPRLTTFAYNYPSYGYPFWKSHFELAMWPLALLYWVWHSSYVLLVVQDLALAGSGVVALRWGIELGREYWPTGRRGTEVVAATLLLVLVVNPWTYWAASYDFHFQPIAMFFVLLAGRDLWSGRRRGWIWVAVVLLCGDVAATYVVALGLSLMLSGRRRFRDGIVLLVLGVAWLLVISLIGSGKGSTIPTSYGYLAGHQVQDGVGGTLAIVVGIVVHPRAPWHMLWSRRDELFKYVAGAGTVGSISVVGLAMTVIVLGANGLNASGVFIGADATFQSLVVVLMSAVGVVAVATWLARRGRLGALVALAMCALVVAQAAYVSVQWTPRARTFLKVPAATAAALTAATNRIRVTDEVVASQGVIGRFAAHRWVYPFIDAFSDGQSIPVDVRNITFVFTDAGLELASMEQTAAAISYVEQQLGAKRVLSRDGVVELRWKAPVDEKAIVLPPS